MVEIVKKKPKKWYSILAPQEFKQIEIGETLTSSPNSLLGKTLKINLMQLTNDIKKQNVNITFKIIQIKDDKAFTEIKKYELLQMAVRRIISKEKNKLDSSFLCKTKDNIAIRLKPLLITKSKTKKSILSTLQNQTKKFLTENISKLSYSELIIYLINYKLQTQLKEHLKKIYPVSLFQIRCLIKK